MIELLAPAGSMESVTAAVQSGANAVYLGYGDFNARRNAKNFSLEELRAAIAYCHLRGVRVFLTLNTLASDRELPKVAETAAQAAQAGVDAILVQDLGILHLLRQVCPQVDLHGSTQLTIHSLDGAKRCADLGMKRVVLSRELSRSAIDHICTHSPIEIETFVHGALCMCYSGQCFFSSVIGGRSGNRGLCAQPCRLKYGWQGKANEYPLSLKDMSLANHLQDLKKLGVACLKIEGRMKRPEYVSVVTGIYARALHENRTPTPHEVAQLEAAFSRQGFTDGYYTDQQDKSMFGIREETAEPKELFAQARSLYQNGEQPLVPITFYAMVRPGEPVQVGVEDDQGRVVTAQGPIPEAARNRPLTAEVVEAQLARTGGTPFACQKVRALVAPDLSLPVAALNALRRQVLEELSAQRSAPPVREIGPFQPGVRYENPKAAPKLTVSVRTLDQATPALLAQKPHLVYLPLDQAADGSQRTKDLVDQAQAQGVTLAVTLPRICWDGEMAQLEHQLKTVHTLGITTALTGSIALITLAQNLGFTLRGDYGLEVFNTQSIKAYKRMGFSSLTPSFELKLAQIRDLSKHLDLEVLAYGRLPLMITETCIIQNKNGRCSCDTPQNLVDRKGEQFPVLQAPGHRNEIFNAKTLFLADKAKDYQKIGAWALRLSFTTESPKECVQVLERYQGQGTYAPKDFTRGLYYRDVE